MACPVDLAADGAVTVPAAALRSPLQLKPAGQSPATPCGSEEPVADLAEGLAGGSVVVAVWAMENAANSRVDEITRRGIRM